MRVAFHWQLARKFAATSVSRTRLPRLFCRSSCKRSRDVSDEKVDESSLPAVPVSQLPAQIQGKNKKGNPRLYLVESAPWFGPVFHIGLQAHEFLSFFRSLYVPSKQECIMCQHRVSCDRGRYCIR